MDFKQLEIFSSLARHLHFAKAAKECHITAPALTRSIQRLEGELGVELLYRNNRQVALSDAGRRFLLFAEQTLGHLYTLQQDLSMASAGVQGEIRVFGSVTASYSVLSYILPVFRQSYPDVDLNLTTGDQAEAIDKVLSGDVDLAIAARPDKLPAGLAFKTLTYSPLKFIMPDNVGQVSQQLVSLQHDGLINPALLPMIVPEEGLTRRRLDKWLVSTKQQANIYASVSGHEAIVSMVALGLGVGLVPEVVIQHSPMREKIKVIENAPELEAFQIGLCVLEKQLKLPTLRAFWDNASPELF